VSDNDIRAVELPKRVLNRSFFRYLFAFQVSWNYERMQALGFCWAMVPVLRHLNADDRTFAEALQRHLAFFNTSPIVGGPFILGTAIAMEEGDSPASADSVKVAMMGPLAGIGDAVTFVLYNSIVFTIGANWALQGNVIGPIFVGVFVLVPYFVVRRWQFDLGYRQGRNLLAHLASGTLRKVNEAAAILGVIVLGGFIPSIVKIVTTLSYRGKAGAGGKPATSVLVQSQLDQVLPYCLPLAVTGLIYLLLRRYHLKTVYAIAIVFAIGLTLGGLGWFTSTLPTTGKH
jgi:mannose/fructose/N-acetylgalactosamine-specific phosphotransferase system component IID